MIGLFISPPKNQAACYRTLCRPLIEYASSVWDPVLEYQIYDNEMTQPRAFRFICDLKGSDSISAALDML